MIGIAPADQDRIERRIKRLPPLLRSEYGTILAFEMIAILIMTYGTCISIFLHPFKQKKPDPSCNLYISCFCYFALSVSAPFTGCHMNPAVTFSNNLHKPNKRWWLYIVAQFIGALIASLLGNYFLIGADWFFDVTPAPYRSHEDILDCFYDFIGETVGFMIFMFAIFRVNQMKYSSGEYFTYLMVSIMLFMSRAFTLRKACLNPMIGTIFQIIIAFKLNDYWLIAYSLPLILGPLLGGLIAYLLFFKLYKPLMGQIDQAKWVKQANE